MFYFSSVDHIYVVMLIFAWKYVMLFYVLNFR